MKRLLCLLAFSFMLFPLCLKASSILIPMDELQKDHLKSYGVAFWVLNSEVEVDWLLNYRGGSFMTPYSKKVEDECKIRGVSYEVLSDAKVSDVIATVNDPSVNMDLVKLFKAPKIAVYSPKDKGPLEDAVVLVLDYAEIPFEYVYDEQIIKGDLPKYDWLHLHHEDFTGQYGKFGNGSDVAWNQRNRKMLEETAKRLGFNKVSKMKLRVAQTIREFCAGGGFLFAMCSGADSFDIALAAANTDIVEAAYDGDQIDPNAQARLDFSQTFAFQNFEVNTVPRSRRFSSINTRDGRDRRVIQSEDFFSLFDFSAKWDVVPSMLTQSHQRVLKGFMGLATAFDKGALKSNVTVMGEFKTQNEVRYIHGEIGKGQWTFYGGHDPEDYQHHPGEPPTDLKLHPNSPGYRLILNNVLFPAAKKKKQKT